MALKGFNCNQPAIMATLAPDWIMIDFGNWLWDESIDYGAAKWALNLCNAYTRQYLTVENIQRVMQIPNYDHIWILLNEPDLEGFAPMDAAASVVTDIQFIVSIDPQAIFGVSCGTFIHPCYKAGSWFDDFWDALPRGIKGLIKILHSHWYPNNVGTSPDGLNVHEYTNRWDNWRTNHVNGRIRAMRLWLTECGVPKSASQQHQNLAALDVIDAACNENNIERWAYYSQQEIGEPAFYYMGLQDSSGNLTARGQTFAAGCIMT